MCRKERANGKRSLQFGISKSRCFQKINVGNLNYFLKCNTL